ncbi:MAG: hypothetical protein H7Z74_04820 [Anaerolineae bacterium]|nr:hypothetical protein [Gemmatimonadaceae bacterium]
MPKPPLWQCPRCGHRFVTKNLWHSCVRVSLATHFRGKPPDRKRTFDRWLQAARVCGPTIAYAQKTRITIQARVRFAGAVVRVGHLDATLWLRRRVTHPLLDRVEDFGRIGYVHHFRLTSPGDIDTELKALMCEAHQVGTQELKAAR